MNPRYGSRKFLLHLGGLVGIHWALWANAIDGADYRVLLPSLLASYGIVNVWQKKSEQPKEGTS